MSQILTKEVLKSNFEDFLLHIENETNLQKEKFNRDLISKIFTYDNNQSNFEGKKGFYNLNSQHKIHFLFNSDKKDFFVARYVLTLESTPELFENYNGILNKDLEEKFKDKIINLNCQSKEILDDYVNKYSYCEFSHKKHSTNQPQILTYKSRILICSKIDNPNEALNIILELYNEHRKVLNIKSN